MRFCALASTVLHLECPCSRSLSIIIVKSVHFPPAQPAHYPTDPPQRAAHCGIEGEDYYGVHKGVGVHDVERDVEYYGTDFTFSEFVMRQRDEERQPAAQEDRTNAGKDPGRLLFSEGFD